MDLDILSFYGGDKDQINDINYTNDKIPGEKTVGNKQQNVSTILIIVVISFVVLLVIIIIYLTLKKSKITKELLMDVEDYND